MSRDHTLEMRREGGGVTERIQEWRFSRIDKGLDLCQSDTACFSHASFHIRERPDMISTSEGESREGGHGKAEVVSEVA